MSSPSLTLLDGSTLEQLRGAALKVLEKTGATFGSSKARAMLADGGCRVDESSGVVRFPGELVEWAVSRLRRDVLLAARGPERDALLDGSRTFLTSTGICPAIVDAGGGRKRDPTLADLSDAVQIMDALDEIGICWFPMSPTADAPGTLSDLYSLGCLLTHTDKHIQGQLVRPEDVPPAMEMLRSAAPDVDLRARPIFSSLYCPVSPLAHEAEAVEAAMLLAMSHVPIDIYSLPIAGATAPMTLAGTVVQALAEELSAVVLFKLVDEDCPLILTADASIMDMRGSYFLRAAPEIALMSMALNELIHSLGAPTLVDCPSPDSYDLNFRGGLETMGNYSVLWLAAPDIAVGAGGVEMSQAVSLPKLVLDAEAAHYCARLREGLAVDEERLAVEVISAVGPGGQFLEQPATVKFLRSGEHWLPDVLRRGDYEAWSDGAPDAVERATQRVAEILEGPRRSVLPDGAAAAIEKVLAEASRQRTRLSGNTARS